MAARGKPGPAAAEQHFVVAAGASATQRDQVDRAFRRRPDLTTDAKQLYELLLDIAIGERAFAGLEQLAAWTVRSVDTVEKHLTLLQRVGLVHKRRLGKQLANIYTLDRSREVIPEKPESPAPAGARIALVDADVIPVFSPDVIPTFSPSSLSTGGKKTESMEIRLHDSMAPLPYRGVSAENGRQDMESWSHGETSRARPKISPDPNVERGKFPESVAARWHAEPPLQPELGIGPGEKRRPPPPSAAIDERADRLSLELCDPGHMDENRSHLRRLWDDSGLPVGVYLELVEVARVRTLDAAGKTKVSAAFGADNKFPYFGVVLAKLVAARVAADETAGRRRWRQSDPVGPDWGADLPRVPRGHPPRGPPGPAS